MEKQPIPDNPAVITIQPGQQPPQYTQNPQPMDNGSPLPPIGNMQWMTLSQAPPPGCPPGLEYLTQVDQLIIKQQIELFEVLTGWETNNKYKITNSLGQLAYFAVEDNDCCTRMCCGPIRPFEMKIVDNFNREVIHLSRPLRCQCCLCWCCLQEIEISAGGVLLGYVIQKFSLWEQKLEITDAQRNTQLLIRGNCCPYSFTCGDVDFQILSLDGETEIGRIRKQWMGCGLECLTDADTFSVTWPMDLDVKTKAVMLGATFLLDFMFYEKQKNNN